MVSSGNSQQDKSKNEQSSSNNNGQDHSSVHRILRQAGLSPSDYTCISPNESTNPEATRNSRALYPQTRVVIDKSRSIRNVQQSPSARNELSKSNSQCSEFVPYSGLNHPSNSTSQPTSTVINTDSIKAIAAIAGPIPPPPPPPIINKRLSNESDKMSRSLFSPRRTPPSPPGLTSEAHHSNLSAEHYLQQINSQDVPPVKVVKPNTQNVVYRKEIRIRYLQPPTPPPPAPIIIREKHEPAPPPQSPLLIRERKPEARTPPPLTIRERPPTPPAPLEPYVIEKSIPAPPPPPRQIIIERLPTPPPKPRTVIFEKWLPYKKLKRPVLLQKAPPIEAPKPTRNVIIEYEPLKAFTVRRVVEEGVFRVDPHDYTSHDNQQGINSGDVRVVERIEDLPPPSEQLMRVLDDYNQPSQHEPNRLSTVEHHQSGSEHIPPSIQSLLADARPVSNGDHLADIARASSLPAYKNERVLSTGFASSTTSPSIISMPRSRSKYSYQPQSSFTPRESPARSHVDDIY